MSSKIRVLLPWQCGLAISLLGMDGLAPIPGKSGRPPETVEEPTLKQFQDGEWVYGWSKTPTWGPGPDWYLGKIEVPAGRCKAPFRIRTGAGCFVATRVQKAQRRKLSRKGASMVPLAEWNAQFRRRARTGKHEWRCSWAPVLSQIAPRRLLRPCERSRGVESISSSARRKEWRDDRTKGGGGAKSFTTTCGAAQKTINCHRRS